MFGYVPTKLDSDAYRILEKFKPNITKYRNISRWFSHIESFSDDERGKFVKMHDKVPGDIECLFPSLEGQVRQSKITHAAIASF